MLPKPLMSQVYTRYALSMGAVRLPATLDIELTNNCNLDCILCSRSRMKRAAGFMDWALLKKIVDNVGPRQLSAVGFHLFGEPLLHPQAASMIRFVRDHMPGTRLFMSTNALLMDRDRSLEILESGLDTIRFSLDGTDRETYESIRRGSSFETVVANVKQFLEARGSARRSTPTVQVQMIGIRETGRHTGLFRKTWEPLLGPGDEILIQKFMTFAGRVPDYTRFSAASWRDRFKRRLPCLRLWKNLVIFWDGRVSACCYDYDGELEVGDLRRETVEDVWNGERIQRMRSAHLDGSKKRLSLCRSCVLQKSTNHEPQ